MSQEPLYTPSEASQLAKFTHKVLIDTDIGDDIDDALALALALNSPEIKLLGVTTVFGDTLQRAHLAAHLLSVSRQTHIPVAAGVSTPLQYRHQPSGVPQAAVLQNNSNPQPNLSRLSGPELIIQTALDHYGQLTLICIGPLTNIATALAIKPGIFMAIRSIIMMGGTSGMPFPEWNMRSDALAAQRVLASGIPITMIGFNVTTRCQLRKHDLDKIRCADAPQTQLLSQLVSIWQHSHKPLHPNLPFLHDPLTIAALCSPRLLRFRGMTVRALVRGPLKGFMIPGVMDGPLVNAAVAVDAAKAREWIMQRLLSPLSL